MYSSRLLRLIRSPGVTTLMWFWPVDPSRTLYELQLAALPEFWAMAQGAGLLPLEPIRWRIATARIDGDDATTALIAEVMAARLPQ